MGLLNCEHDRVTRASRTGWFSWEKVVNRALPSTPPSISKGCAARWQPFVILAGLLCPELVFGPADAVQPRTASAEKCICALASHQDTQIGPQLTHLLEAPALGVRQGGQGR